MPDQDPPRRSINHTDEFVNDLRSDDAATRDVDVTYQASDDGLADTTDKGPVDHSHPVDDVSKLPETAHLDTQLRHKITGPDTSDEAEPFDAALLAVASRALAAEDTAFDELPIATPRAKALFVYEARAINSIRALVRHLTQNDQTAQLYGWPDTDAVPSSDRFYVAVDALEDADVKTSIENAALRAVYALYRNGIPFPESLRSTYQFDDLEPIVAECDFDEEIRQAALRNWGRELLPLIQDALTFHRGQNTTYSMRQILGLFAQSALENAGLDNSARTAAWHYDDDHIPGGDGVWGQVKSLSMGDIDGQFMAANAGLIEYASDRGLLADSPNLAADKTGIGWSGQSNEWTVGRPNKRHIDAEWVFAALSVMSPSARLTLGIRFVKDKSRTTEKFRELLAFATEQLDPNRVFADREFHDGDAIRAFRDHLGPDWVIHAKEQNEVADVVEATPRGETDGARNIGEFVTPRPNVIVVPDPHEAAEDDEDVMTELTEFTEYEYTEREDDAALTQGSASDEEDVDGVGVSGTHKPFLTDLEPDDTSGPGIFFDYDRRWNVETFIRQMKHDVMPLTESKLVKPRLYAANIAVVFHNIHTLVNALPSPHLAIPLDATHQEVLHAIRHVAYTTT